MTVIAGGLFAQTQPANDGVQQDASDPFHIKTTIMVPESAGGEKPSAVR
jgi:hypothetical protein